MTSTNRSLVRSLVGEIEAFSSNGADIEDIQWKIETCISLLERGSVDYSSILRSAEGDLEAILYGRLLSEQQAAATFRLDALRDELLRGLAQEPGDL